MSRRGRYTLLLVPDDGRRVLRLRLSPGAGLVALGLVLLGPATLALVWNDVVSLDRRRAEVTALQRLTSEQRQLLETLGRRVGEIQSEVATWRGVHARIWEPIGPEASHALDRHGIGGGGSPLGEEAEPAAVAGRVERLALSVSEEGRKLRALERLMGRLGKVLATLPSRWPVRGAVNSEFGRRVSPWSAAPEHHSGIDIAADAGTPVRAPAAGTVAFAGAMVDYGITVVIDHGHEIKTLFGHLQKVQVAAGERVHRGQQIALAGNTGRSSGPHLHYEITVRGQAVDPRGYLWD